ncbi:MAG: SDR family NAD(P)-dependent oxidoreductase, partial [Acidimicrobiales bacterium]
MAFVSGASRGIGKQSAIYLARAGFDVAIGARTVKEGDSVDESGRTIPGSLETTTALIEETGRGVLPVAMDLLDRESLSLAVERVLEEWGRVDVLVNNAVHTDAGSMDLFVDLSLSTIETKLQANVIA